MEKYRDWRCRGAISGKWHLKFGPRRRCGPKAAFRRTLGDHVGGVVDLEWRVRVVRVHCGGEWVGESE